MTPGFFSKARRKHGVTIRLDSHPIKVLVRTTVLDSDGVPVNGTWDGAAMVIVVRDMTPISLMREALLHEMIHAVNTLRELSFPSDEAEEDYVKDLSAGLTGLLAQTGTR